MEPALPMATEERLGAPNDRQADDSPRRPVVLIEAERRWAALDFKALWQYRELFYFLMWRDVKVRYKQTLFGILWAILQPLVTMLIFTYFFGKLARVPAEGVPYPVFFYAGLVIWGFFSNSVMMAANSPLGNTNLITKVYFPRLIIPGATVGAGLLDFAIAAALLVGMLLFYRFPLTAADLLLLPLVVLITLLAFAVGVLLAALNVRYRDVRYTIPFLIQLWFYVTPIAYPAGLITGPWRVALALNPLTGIVEGCRWALIGTGALDGLALALSIGISLPVLVAGLYHFRRVERRFADLV